MAGDGHLTIFVNKVYPAFLFSLLLSSIRFIYFPVNEPAIWATSSGVPVAMISPPLYPPSAIFGVRVKTHDRLLMADSSQSSDLAWLYALRVSCRPISDIRPNNDIVGNKP